MHMLMAIIKKGWKRYLALPLRLRASFWFLICAFLQRGISVLTTPVFTRLLTAEEYGQYSVFNSWMGIISVFVTLNLSSGVYSQGLVKFSDRRKSFISSMQGLCFTLVVFWTAVYLAFQNFWNRLFSLTTVQMLAMLAMTWSSTVFKFWAVEQRVELNYRKLVVLTLIVSLAKPLVGIVFVMFAKDKVTARILGIFFVELIAYSGLFMVQMMHGKKFFSGYFWVYAARFNLPLIPHYLSTTILNSADRIMISSMVGDAQAGVYSVAYSISQIMGLFNIALLQTFEPWIYQKIKECRTQDIGRVAYIAFLLIAVVNLMLIALAPEVISLFAPTAYHEAVVIIPPVAMSTYFTFLYSFFATFEFYFEKTRYIAAATMVGAALNVALNSIFIRLYGYYAAGYTTLFCYMVFAFCHYMFMRKVCQKKLHGIRVYNVRILLGITVGFMMGGFALLFLYEYPIARFGILAVIGGTCVWQRRKVLDIFCQLKAPKKLNIE